MHPASDPMAVQHGGDHYKNMGVQPFEYGLANAYDPAIFSVMKYVSRHHLKNGREDLQKAAHIVDIRVVQSNTYGPFRKCLTVISPERYIEENGLQSLEAEIIRELHDWGLGNPRPDHMPHATILKQQIAQLADLHYHED